MANQAQFILAGVPAVSLASYIPISGTEKDVSVTQSSDASRALQASRPLPQPQDTQTINSVVRPYETAAPDTPAMDRVPKDPKPTLTPEFAAVSNTAAKTSEAEFAPNLLRAETAARQSGKIPSNANSDGGITSKIAMPPSPADPVKAPGAAVVVRSQTHFVPEAAKAAQNHRKCTAVFLQDAQSFSSKVHTHFHESAHSGSGSADAREG